MLKFGKRYSLYISFVILTYTVWAVFMFSNDYFGVWLDNFEIAIVMIFGSFIAGVSSEGGGAVAFPVLTLIFETLPSEARNFSLAIQSIGMTAATLLIIGLRVKLEKTALLYASIGGLVGILIGAYFVADHLPPKEIKLFFVSLWLAFGYALYRINRDRKREINEKIINPTPFCRLKLVAFGIMGGAITSIFGNGIDIMTFCLITLHFKVSEKVATPTSVVLMTVNTVIGYIVHAYMIGDFGMGQGVAFDFWVTAIPIVVFGAPLGAFVCSLLSRKTIGYILYAIILVQFVGAMIILQPNAIQIVMSLTVIISGVILFYFLSKRVNGVPTPAQTPDLEKL